MIDVYTDLQLGPQEVTAGPYKDIRLELFESRISDLHVSSKLSPTLDKAVVTAEVEIQSTRGDDEVEIQLEAPKGSSEKPQFKKFTRTGDSKTVKVDFEVANPELWWPARYGKQPLYNVVTRIQKDVCSIKPGICSISLPAAGLDCP